MEPCYVNWSRTSAAATARDTEHSGHGSGSGIPLPPPPLPDVDAADPVAEAAAALEAAQLKERAEEEERRADAVWRELQEEQRRRTLKAEEERWQEEQAQREAAERARYRERQQVASAAAAAAATAVVATPPATLSRDEHEPDGMGWTLLEQRALEAAMRTYPTSMERKSRWAAISAAVGAKTPKECVARCRAVATAVKAALPPPLLRLQSDASVRVLQFLGGRDLCALAASCRELTTAAHDDLVWRQLGDALPAGYAYSKRDRAGEPVWKYTLRTRLSLFGSWRMLTEHRAGAEPYLAELGTYERGRFRPTGGRLPYRIKYGAICELVMREAKQQGGLNHRVYKEVADLLISLSANSKSSVPPELHMTVREIFKTAYPGFGAATGSGAYSPGLQAGGSSAKGHASGSMVGKGVGVTLKKVQDEEMRKRLETYHEFMALVA